MNKNFDSIIQATDDDRRGLFLTTAARLGTAVQNVEKDFWVCWTLDALFNGLQAGGRACYSRAAHLSPKHTA